MTLKPMMSWKLILAIVLFEIVFVTGLIVWALSTIKVDL